MQCNGAIFSLHAGVFFCIINAVMLWENCTELLQSKIRNAFRYSKLITAYSYTNTLHWLFLSDVLLSFVLSHTAVCVLISSRHS